RMVPDTALVGAAIAVILRPIGFDGFERAVVECNREGGFKNTFGLFEPFEYTVRNVEIPRRIVDLPMETVERICFLGHVCRSLTRGVNVSRATNTADTELSGSVGGTRAIEHALGLRDEWCVDHLAVDAKDATVLGIGFFPGIEHALGPVDPFVARRIGVVDNSHLGGMDR